LVVVLEGRTALATAATGSTDATVGLTAASTGRRTTGTGTTDTTGRTVAALAAGSRFGVAAFTGITRSRTGGNRAARAAATGDRDRRAALSTGTGVHLVAARATRGRSSLTTVATFTAGRTVTTVTAGATGAAVTTVRTATTSVTTGTAAATAAARVGQRGPDDEEHGAERQHQKP
jgi:hypothetical protein